MELEHIFKDIKIKSYLDQENNPWFKGKDVAATILGYKKTEKAIQTHIYEEFKSSFLNLQGPPIPGGPCNQNDLKTIYINEPGLYQLLSKSKIGKEFNIWLYSEVIPSIRKRGEYKVKQEEQNKIKQELSIEFEQKLSIMDSKISEIQRQSELDKQNAEKEYTLRLAKEKELEEKNKQIELLTNHLKKH